jgi:hypothetical protein
MKIIPSETEVTKIYNIGVIQIEIKNNSKTFVANFKTKNGWDTTIRSNKLEEIVNYIENNVETNANDVVKVG